ncbi:MAG: UvrD-helicase domain-containing protein [Acidobacteria bacterium]|nr:UvrD-helicase domain-containing protein [Acidobacteriota bacterium]
MDLFTDLNEKQKAAALAPLGPWLVLAGPGTGKTRTLVARIVALIEKFKIKPDHLLAVTYTNKATEEMRERLKVVLGDRAMSLQVSTFHAFCIGVLREYHEKIGLPKHFTIADEDCQLRIVARIAPMISGERHMRYLISRISGARLNSGDVRPLTNLEHQLYKRYEGELKKNALIDFDDILFFTQRLFFENPIILNRYRHIFDGILVDEFQDTDRVQYEILRLLVSEHRNLFAVADDDQSIFSWRGANPTNIDLFLKDFARENVIVLTENYRSRREIIAQAQILIAQHSKLARKNIQASRIDIDSSLLPIRIEHFASDYDEAEFIIGDIRQNIEKSPELSYSDFAILYARHSVGEFLEREFMKADLPCQLVKGRSCFDQLEIMRAMSLLRVLYNPKDQFSLESFVSKEVDEVTSTRLKAFQQEERLDFRISLDRFRKSSRIPEQERRQIDRIIGLISNLISIKNTPGKRLSDLFADILNSLGNQEVMTLSKQVENLSDPITYNRMRDGARTVYEARIFSAPILVSTSNPQLNFLALEMLKRGLGITAYSAHAFVVQQIPVQDKPSDKENITPKPVLIALDGQELDFLIETVKTCQKVIYLGTDYSPKIREQLQNINAIVINPEELSIKERGFEPSAILLLFKLCQLASWLGNAEFLPDYVAIDIETTDREVETNDIIEIAAIRVRDGRPVGEFHTLLKPVRPIAPDAAKVHGITDIDLVNAPSFKQITERFLNFIGQDTLVAHNGYNFDFPCIKRKLREIGFRLENRTFDTLPMASRLFPDRGASLDALASLFSIDTGKRHRAYDDTLSLVEVFEGLKKEHASRLRRTACEQCLDIVAAGSIVEHNRLVDPQAILIKEGLIRLAAPSATLIERLVEQGNDVTLLRGHIEQAKLEHLREGEGNADRFGAFLHFDEIVSRFDSPNPSVGTLEKSIIAFLDFAALYQQQDGIARRNAINMMTIYASKGLEFSRVYIVGLEQNMIPSFYAVGSKNPEQLAEQRRLLYVAITRAKEQLVFTTATLRNGYVQLVSEFLTEILSTQN